MKRLWHIIDTCCVQPRNLPRGYSEYEHLHLCHCPQYETQAVYGCCI